MESWKPFSVCLQISEELPDVGVQCATDLNIYREEKDANHTWTFTLSTTVGFVHAHIAYIQNPDGLN